MGNFLGKQKFDTVLLPDFDVETPIGANKHQEMYFHSGWTQSGL